MSQLAEMKKQIIWEVAQYFQENWEDEDEVPTYDAVEAQVENLIEEYYSLGQIDDDLRETLLDSTQQMISEIFRVFSSEGAESWDASRAEYDWVEEDEEDL